MLWHRTPSNHRNLHSDSWEHGGEPGKGVRWSAASPTPAAVHHHYISLEEQPVRHDYGDVYSVSQGYDAWRRDDAQRPQQPANALWRDAPWTDTNVYEWRR